MRISDWSSDVCSSDLARSRSLLELEYDARVSSRVVAVTMIAGSSANPAARTESLPAAITGIAPLLQAYSTASQNAQPSVAWRAPPPSERLMTSAPRSAAQRMPAATSAAVPVGLEEHTSELSH